MEWSRLVLREGLVGCEGVHMLCKQMDTTASRCFGLSIKIPPDL